MKADQWILPFSSHTRPSRSASIDGGNQLFVADMAYAPNVLGGSLLALYGPYVCIVNKDTGACEGLWSWVLKADQWILPFSSHTRPSRSASIDTTVTSHSAVTLNKDTGACEGLWSWGVNNGINLVAIAYAGSVLNTYYNAYIDKYFMIDANGNVYEEYFASITEDGVLNGSVSASIVRLFAWTSSVSLIRPPTGHTPLPKEPSS